MVHGIEKNIKGVLSCSAADHPGEISVKEEARQLSVYNLQVEEAHGNKESGEAINVPTNHIVAR